MRPGGTFLLGSTDLPPRRLLGPRGLYGPWKQVAWECCADFWQITG